MAQANKLTKLVPVPSPPPPPPRRVKNGAVLELSEPELRTLSMILQCVGGRHGTTARKYVNSINKALDAAGVERVWPSVVGGFTGPEAVMQKDAHRIYFTDASLAVVEEEQPA